MLLVENRRVLLQGLYGSKNYNLDTDKDDERLKHLKGYGVVKPSDSDTKCYVMPNLLDVYEGKFYHKESVCDKEDLFAVDFRRLAGILFKPTIALLEPFFSDDLYVDKFSKKELDKLLALKNDFAKMSLPCLYSSCKGTYFKNMNTLTEASESSKYLVDAFGYNTKKALTVYRVLDFIVRFHSTDFSDFKWAMTYSNEEREDLLRIKFGEYTLEEFTKLATNKYEEYKLYEKAYCSQKEDEELSLHLHELTKEVFFKNSRSLLLR